MADSLLDRVTGIITRYNMASPGDRIGVAVSGGADSVVLLHLLRKLSEQLRISLVVLHLNHGLRGTESDADEEFVRAMAQSLELPIVVEQTAIPGGSNLEQAARLARREFYQRSIEKNSLRGVALGHTRSDQAETVLFRFLRGSGTAGLAGMAPLTRDGLLRPMLTSTRDEVRGWAMAHGVGWREDSSNADLVFSRNLLREQIMPALARDFNSNLEAVLSRAADVAHDEEDYWFQQVEPLFEQFVAQTRFGLLIDTSSLAALHIAVQRRLIRRAMLELRGDLRSIEIKHVDAVLGLCSSNHGHDRVIVPGVDALRSFDKLRLARSGVPKFGERGYRLALAIGEECQLPFQAGHISLNREQNLGSSFCANFKKEQDFAHEIAQLDGDALTEKETLRPLYVRNWEAGDALQRSGHTGTEKVKTLFQEHRVLLWERRHWPVVVCGEEIVWTRRFGSAARFRRSPESRHVIRLTYRATPLGARIESKPG